MGSGSHQYCAICGVTLGSGGLDIGPKTERAKRLREQRIMHGLRERAGIEERFSDDEADFSDDDDDEHWSEMEPGYDPEVMENRDATLPNYDRFYDHVRLVAYDPAIKSPSKCFLSGEAFLDTYGRADADGGHPERPNDQLDFAVNEYQPEEIKAFPCHELCLQIAAKVIVGNPSSRLLNPDVLYKLMCDLQHKPSSSIRLDYGDFDGRCQYWNCWPGEEFCIMNPFEFYRLHMQTLVHLTIEHERSDKQTSSVGTQNTVADLFQKLSNELIHRLANYLEGKDMFQLRQASMIVREATNGNNFWMPRVQNDLRWLWIPNDLFAKGAGGSSPTDWMKVCLLFDSATAEPWGMRGMYMALANRRRIWNVCEQLKSLYMSHTAGNGQPITNPSPGPRASGRDNEIGLMWSEPLDALESYEQWLK